MYALKRKPKSLSYSALSLYESDRSEFFLRYLAGNRAPRLPQQDFMAVGAGFDAYEKAELHAAIFGPGSDPRFEFDAIFCEQVEEQNRDFVRKAGKHIFDCYKMTGAHAELLSLLEKSVEPPQFESKVEGKIAGKVPFLGKPDCRFVLKCDELVHIILDWKVKGYCSRHGASPSKGYTLCRDGYVATKQSRSHLKEHDKYLAYNHRGLTINQGYLEACNVEYADQVSTYGWLLGEKIGDENVVVFIDEIVAKYMHGDPPLLRVANHRARVSSGHQHQLLSRILKCWESIESGHIFDDMSPEDSDRRCSTLEQTAIGLHSDGSDLENFFNESSRSVFRK